MPGVFLSQQAVNGLRFQYKAGCLISKPFHGSESLILNTERAFHCPRFQLDHGKLHKFLEIKTNAKTATGVS